MNQIPKNTLTIVILSIVYFFTSCTGTEELDKLQFSLSIPTEGNSWVVDNHDKNQTLIGENGIKNWVDKETKIRTYFKTEIGGIIDVGLIAKSSEISEVKITLGENISTINVENSTLDTIKVGKFEIKEPGYHFVEIQGIEKSGDYFPEIQAILIGGDATTGKVWFARDDFYWGRRGPSVHLNYQVPEEAGDVVYFYNEITVPEGNDVLT